MKRRVLLGLAAVALLAACGQNPLLKLATADYAPFKVGDQWTYAKAGGGTSVRTVVAALAYAGRSAYQVNVYDSALGTTSPTYTSDDGAELDVYDPILGWVLSRKLPYVVGNRWALPQSQPNRTDTLFVDGTEKILTPAGSFANCFRLRQQSTVIAGGVTTTSTTAYLWAAPDVGDVQAASVDLSGTSSVTSQLSSFKAGP